MSTVTAESDVIRRRLFFPDRPSSRVNNDRNSPELLNAPTTTNDGSGDASVVGLPPSPRSGRQQSPRSGRQQSPRSGRQQSLANHVIDARAVLDREMVLLMVTMQSTRIQFAAVGRDVEMALEAAEDYVRVMQERNANVTEGSRSAAAMLPLSRSAHPTSSPLESPPPIGHPSAEAMPVTRRLLGRTWLLANCVIFAILAVLLVVSDQNYNCRHSQRRHSSDVDHTVDLLDHLVRWGLVKRNPGPRPM